MLFEAITSTAIIPKRGSKFAAGYDFHADHDFVVGPYGRCLVKTGIRTNFDPSTYLQLKSRSGLAAKHGICTGAGVIDSDYQGEIGVVLFNHSNEAYVGNSGDKISQGIFLPLANPEKYYPIETSTDSVTERGDGGFGSTGK